MIKNIFAFFTTSVLLVVGQALWKVASAQVRGANGLLDLISKISTNLPFLIGCIFYVTASALWIYLLGQFEYSKIYPIFVGTCIVFSLFVGILFFQENLSILPKIIGSIFILCGVIIITSFS